MRWTVATLLGAGVLLVLGYVVLFGGRESAFLPVGLAGGAVALLPERARVRVALRDAAVRYGLDPDWLDAIGWVESRWRLDAVGDDGRSVGPTQIQRNTLWANGYSGSGDELLADAELAAEWTARLMVAGAKNAEGRTLKATPTTLEDLAAWWNAGRQRFADLPEGHRTREKYAPQLASAADSLSAGKELA